MMRRRRIEQSDQFKRDLDIVWNTMAEHSLAAADRLRDDVLVRLLKLGEAPGAGGRRDDLPDDLRSYVIKSWVLVYAYDAERIVAVRLVHGARDFRRLF